MALNIHYIIYIVDVKQTDIGILKEKGALDRNNIRSTLIKVDRTMTARSLGTVCFGTSFKDAIARNFFGQREIQDGAIEELVRGKGSKAFVLSTTKNLEKVQVIIVAKVNA